MPKKLDRFLLCEAWAEKLSFYRHRVREGGISDQFPNLLEMKGEGKKPGIPFKFNSSWLKDESYINIFHATWRKDALTYEGNRSSCFMDNLNRMKHATKEWALQKKL